MIPSKNNTCLVSIQVVGVVSTDPQWGDQLGWTENRKAWVSINPDRGREVFSGGELESVITHTIRGDFLTLNGVTEKMRIIYNDTHQYVLDEEDDDAIRADSLVFNILAVMPDHDHRRDIMIQAHLDNLRYGDLPPDIPQ